MNDASEPGSSIGVAFEIPVSRAAFRAVRGYLASFASDHGFGGDKVRDLLLAVTEALHNAAEHGAGEGGCVGLALRLVEDVLEVAVEDDGGRCGGESRLAAVRAFFEDRAAGGPLPDSERGRGLYLIRKKSDDVRVESRPDGGVRLVLVKRR